MSNTESPDILREWDPQLSEAGKAHMEQLRAKIEPRIKFAKQLHEALGLSDSEFLEFVTKEDQDRPPVANSRGSLTLYKLQTFLEERGGSLKLVITLDGKEHIIPS